MIFYSKNSDLTGEPCWSYRATAAPFVPQGRIVAHAKKVLHHWDTSVAEGNFSLIKTVHHYGWYHTILFLWSILLAQMKIPHHPWFILTFQKWFVLLFKPILKHGTFRITFCNFTLLHLGPGNLGPGPRPKGTYSSVLQSFPSMCKAQSLIPITECVGGVPVHLNFMPRDILAINSI